MELKLSDEQDAALALGLEAVEVRAADKQGGLCVACSEPLLLAGAVLAFVGEGPAQAVPVLVHADCLTELRRYRTFARFRKNLAPHQGDAEKARAVLDAVVSGHMTRIAQLENEMADLERRLKDSGNAARSWREDFDRCKEEKRQLEQQLAVTSRAPSAGAVDAAERVGTAGKP